MRGPRPGRHCSRCRSPPSRRGKPKPLPRQTHTSVGRPRCPSPIAAGQSTATPMVNRCPSAASSRFGFGAVFGQHDHRYRLLAGQRLLHRGGETAARTHLHERPGAQRLGGPHPVGETDRLAHVVDPVLRRPVSGTGQLPSQVGHQADSRWQAETPATSRGELLEHRLHQRGMERVRNRQCDAPAGPAAPAHRPPRRPRASAPEITTALGAIDRRDDSPPPSTAALLPLRWRRPRPSPPRPATRPSTGPRPATTVAASASDSTPAT